MFSSLETGLARKRPWLRLLSWCLVSIAVAAAFFAGIRLGRIFEQDAIFRPLGTSRWSSHCLARFAGLEKTYAQAEQDLWVTRVIAPGRRNGYYVDVGSADGERISNTKLLDDLGWKGVCVDPFPANMQRRTCQVFRQPVSATSGKRARFRAAGEVGGITEFLGLHKDWASDASEVELVTATLDEILAKAQAPTYIDYMSIDVEGSEYEALLGLSFDKYKIGSFTIEHNFELGKRESIRKLLESKGYIRVRSWEVDDWYVPSDVAAKFPLYRGGLQ